MSTAATRTSDRVTSKSAGGRTRSRSLPVWAVPAAILALIVVLSAVRALTGVEDVLSSGTIAAAITFAMPIALAGLGGLWSERAGVVNIGLEGMMVLGTFGAAFGALHGGPWAGVLGAILGGLVGGLVHAVATVTFGVDHIVSGVALNILAVGAASYLAARFFSGTAGGGATQSPPLPQLPTLTVPGLSAPLLSLEQKGVFLVSDLAAILRALTTGVSVLTLLGLLIFVATWWILWRTPFGLRLRSCGEAPAAAESVGVNVYLHKFVAVLVSGGLAGLAGGFLAMVAANQFKEGQTGGRGYIALAAMIFGNWRPGGLLGGSALFGYTDAVQLRGGGTSIHALFPLLAVLLLAFGVWRLVGAARAPRPVGGWRAATRFIGALVILVIGLLFAVLYVVTDSVPGEFTNFAPHLMTLLVLAFASQRLRMPAADGQVYRKGEVR